ncbi:MAG TPA: sigma-70 family RNA polymerase sigma factor [Opitutaceae bacterium]|nr:sigma-70 family RNA polymerase sigma factor [Opitutaceae bacterium]
MGAADTDLLRDYAQGAEAAFATLVERHLNLVYSAARRQVRSPHLAEEVAQSVFVELARCAAKIPPTQPLAAWLYVVTRRTAIDTVRREARRLARETTAAELAAMHTSSESWSKIEASLDEAMATLNETERTAIILRFFENLSLREVGESLGISEDTAQKRVSRALDRLRVFFAARGVAVGSSAFAVTLSAHAVQAAPAGLAAAISSATAALPSAAIAAAKQLAMTTAQKTFASLALAAALGFALYEGVPALRLRAEVHEGQQQLDRLAATARQLSLEQTAAARELARLDSGRAGASPSAEPGSDAALAQEAAAWSARIARLQRELAQHPELAIPELSLLTDHDWILASRQDFSRPERVRESLLLLRTRAKSNFLHQLGEATRNYVASAHALPERFDQLTALAPPLDPAILNRYDFQRENNWLVVAEKAVGAVDPDRLAVVGDEYSGAAGGFNGFSRMESTVDRAVREAAQTYVKAHGGARPASAAQLLPFLPQPVDPATLEQTFRVLPSWLQPAAATSP